VAPLPNGPVKNANLVFRTAACFRRLLAASHFLGWRRPGFQPVALAVALLLGGCGAEKPAAVAVAPKPAAEFFSIVVGGKTVRMQLAVLQSEMEHGLMGRRDLGRDDGMIFIYEKPQQMGFWMHDCPTALDIGFFDHDGMLEEIYPMYPFDEKTVSSRSTQLQFALEMNQGWFAANGVKPGMEFDRKALAAAVKARGFDPAKYGLQP